MKDDKQDIVGDCNFEPPKRKAHPGPTPHHPSRNQKNNRLRAPNRMLKTISFTLTAVLVQLVIYPVRGYRNCTYIYRYDWWSSGFVSAY